MPAHLTFAVDHDLAAEHARGLLIELGLGDHIATLAEQRDRDLDAWGLAEFHRAREKAKPEPVRALRRAETLILNGLQEEDHPDAA